MRTMNGTAHHGVPVMEFLVYGLIVIYFDIRL